ncbi:GyrI-like domain-containing protein [Demequina pelophila]|uniref:GyrI-like domain-containing protein n=1 Tax=Demequina pelophila TaxID=1638984 RepID=UPI000782D32F|nr:GyrI-like domain-containing protein [Demequina pelophila]
MSIVREYRVEHLGRRTYVGVPLEFTMATLEMVVSEAFESVADAMAEHGLVGGEGVIRYRRMAPEGTFAVEVGYVVRGDVEPPPGLGRWALPAGTYAIAAHEGPYADLSAETGSFLVWADEAGHRPSMEVTGAGSGYACYYEAYLETPREGPKGPEGSAEIRMLLG